MAALALATPVTFIAGSPGGGSIAGTVLPAAESSLATFTGFSVPNNGAVLVRVVVGASGAGNLNFVIQRQVAGASLTALTAFQQAVANSTTYVYGPFPPSIFNDVNGLLQATISVVTGNSVGAYLLPGSAAGS